MAWTSLAWSEAVPSVALAAGKGAGDPDRDINPRGAESGASLVRCCFIDPWQPFQLTLTPLLAHSHVEPDLVPEAGAATAHCLGQVGISCHRSRAPYDSVATEERRAENRVMAERERIVQAASGPVRHVAEEPRILRLDVADLAATHLPGAGLSAIVPGRGVPGDSAVPGMRPTDAVLPAVCQLASAPDSIITSGTVVRSRARRSAKAVVELSHRVGVVVEGGFGELRRHFSAWIEHRGGRNRRTIRGDASRSDSAASHRYGRTRAHP